MFPFGPDETPLRTRMAGNAHIRPDLPNCLIVEDCGDSYRATLRIGGRPELLAHSALLSDIAALHDLAHRALAPVLGDAPHTLPAVDAADDPATSRAIRLAFGDRAVPHDPHPAPHAPAPENQASNNCIAVVIQQRGDGAPAPALHLTLAQFWPAAIEPLRHLFVALGTPGARVVTVELPDLVITARFVSVNGAGAAAVVAD